MEAFGEEAGEFFEIRIGNDALGMRGSHFDAKSFDLARSMTLMSGEDPVVDGGAWAKYSLNWPEVVIGGGTPNIQKNIIAERILGLPKD